MLLQEPCPDSPACCLALPAMPAWRVCLQRQHHNTVTEVPPSSLVTLSCFPHVTFDISRCVGGKACSTKPSACTLLPTAAAATAAAVTASQSSKLAMAGCYLQAQYRG